MPLTPVSYFASLYSRFITRVERDLDHRRKTGWGLFGAYDIKDVLERPSEFVEQRIQLKALVYTEFESSKAISCTANSSVFEKPMDRDSFVKLDMEVPNLSPRVNAVDALFKRIDDWSKFNYKCVVISGTFMEDMPLHMGVDPGPGLQNITAIGMYEEE